MKTNKKNNESAKQVMNEIAKGNVSAYELLNQKLKKSEIPVSSLGGKRESLYNPEMFADCKEKDEIKSRRISLRKKMLAICKGLINSPTAKNIEEFREFYQAIYICNDYSLASVCNKNMDKDNQEIMKKALEIAKKK